MIKVNFHPNKWQCPDCKRWRFTKRTGRRLSKCQECNITVDINVAMVRVEKIDYQIQSVKFVRQGKKRS